MVDLEYDHSKTSDESSDKDAESIDLSEVRGQQTRGLAGSSGGSQDTLGSGAGGGTGRGGGRDIDAGRALGATKVISAAFRLADGVAALSHTLVVGLGTVVVWDGFGVLGSIGGETVVAFALEVESFLSIQ